MQDLEETLRNVLCLMECRWCQSWSYLWCWQRAGEEMRGRSTAGGVKISTSDQRERENCRTYYTVRLSLNCHFRKLLCHIQRWESTQCQWDTWQPLLQDVAIIIIIIIIGVGYSWKQFSLKLLLNFTNKFKIWQVTLN